MAFIVSVAPFPHSSVLSVLRSTPLRTQVVPRYCPTPLRRTVSRCTADASAPRVDTTRTGAADDARVALWREVEALRSSLQLAVRAERFADAARLRDRIQSLSLADEYFRTNADLKAAVADQRFADAARLRDILHALDPPPDPTALPAPLGPGLSKSAPTLTAIDAADVKSWSRTITAGVHVYVDSYYMPEQSVPEHNRYLFGYKVTIKNDGEETCQLVSRHWIIKSDGSPENEVRGPGVVGRQPVLEPGESFEYTSACPITVPLQPGQNVVGSMRGEYHFCKGDTGNVTFNVTIDPFFFKLPFNNYRPSGPSPQGMPWTKP